MTDRLAEIEARAAKATEGPWVMLGDEIGGQCGWKIKAQPSPILRGFTKTIAWLPAPEELPYLYDAELLAHSRDDIPWLCSQLRTAQADNARLREALKECAFKLANCYVERTAADADPVIVIARAALKE